MCVFERAQHWVVYFDRSYGCGGHYFECLLSRLRPRSQGMYIMFHHMKGTPYPTGDQGDVRRLTNWEQIDNGQQYTPTRIFLTAVPIALYATLPLSQSAFISVSCSSLGFFSQVSTHSKTLGMSPQT